MLLTDLCHPACSAVTTHDAVVDAVANSDWATVAVFTCQGSCSSVSQPPPAAAAAAGGAKQQQCGVFAEAVFVINEQDCHIALPPPVPGVGAGAEAGATASPETAAAAAAAAGPAENQDDEDSLQDEED
jgi:hypothetical protein